MSRAFSHTPKATGGSGVHTWALHDRSLADIDTKTGLTTFKYFIYYN